MSRVIAGLKWGLGAAVAISAVLVLVSWVSGWSDPSAAAAGPFLVMMFAPIAFVAGGLFGIWRGR